MVILCWERVVLIKKLDLYNLQVKKGRLLLATMIRQLEKDAAK